ncbi:hypothetical protein DDE82_001582 [Stemphylium lycopersici]|uniref:Uncharacterized protein n=1 Tax=Stemphylium lycopersici TaxID=183478 RepID=A0A364MZM3_STELY|nr:hypothetical protein TW65_03464 [Stemphylium lycopersici]RAR07983.1 hypothetical protein DDE83_006228 [Stemphylium lycopersici]RAR09865.1 hypothetical protein DDE82_001582 [Stemphylium lycopersici]
MRFYIATALLALGPTLGAACSRYAFCHCTNNDGSINDAATKASCPDVVADYMNVDGTFECAADSAAAGLGGVFQFFINNCRMREVCNSNGAPGDSNCHAKA